MSSSVLLRMPLLHMCLPWSGKSVLGLGVTELCPLPLLVASSQEADLWEDLPHTPLLLTKCDWTGVRLPLFQRFHQSLSVCLLCSENEIVMMEYCANAQTPACRRHCGMQVYRAGCFPAHPNRLLL